MAAVALASTAVACRATSTNPFSRPTDDPDGGPIVIGGGGRSGDVPQATPHALLAIEPTHGPFSGGTVVRLRGNGFAGNVRVWFGDNEVPPEDVIALSPQRVQVVAPPGEAGAVDVVAQNGDDESTRVAFKSGFTYDSFYAEPNTGPTSGGTLVRLYGQGTSWDEDTEVFIDREPCEIVDVIGPEELVCRAPAGAAGSRPIRVTTSDGVAVDLLDGFTYGDTQDGFRGGLSGDRLKDELHVIAFDSVTGAALPGTTVVIGADDPIVERTDKNGMVVVRGEFDGPQTVTIARRCFQPTTFVGVEVARVTAYLDPVLASTCFSPEGDIPAGGGNPGRGSSISGELVWPSLQEFRRDGWTNVPPVKSDSEKHVAYVFPLAPNPTDRFSLPSAVSAVTPSAGGEFGFQFSLSVRPGNYTLYAVAGIEDRSRRPYRFTAYSMGLIRGVSAAAGDSAENVFLRVDLPLDHALTLHVDGPEPTRRGPDRLEVSVAVQVGTEGYVVLPGTRASTLLGGPAELSIVGLPPLTRSLAGARYVATASALTGATGGVPSSVLTLLGSTTTAEPLDVSGFLEVPVLSEPATNTRWDGRTLAWSSARGGVEPDLVIIDVATANALYNWRVIAEGFQERISLPDLESIDPELAWPRGPQTIRVQVARLERFAFGELSYRDLVARRWLAHAADTFTASY